ncbi:unnamed protein product [Effrenium voratum]|uniref:Uncharacterized protein n=1 Tax=Effrenium voratum TaxID=2562239 RepID=A0AA36I5D1_9DINO|nr:unnamed protein product [Effrenium voratum]CAJ1442752.1 unnamed protein product [Effrenium voratum]
MFRVKEIEAALRGCITDEMKNIMLIHESGSIIASAHPKEVDHAAVMLLSSAATEYKCAEQYVVPEERSDFEGVIFFTEKALVACRCFLSCTESSMMLLAVWCDAAAAPAPGLLLSRLELLKHLAFYDRAGRTALGCSR